MPIHDGRIHGYASLHDNEIKEFDKTGIFPAKRSLTLTAHPNSRAYLPDRYSNVPLSIDPDHFERHAEVHSTDPPTATIEPNDDRGTAIARAEIDPRTGLPIDKHGTVALHHEVAGDDDATALRRERKIDPDVDGRVHLHASDTPSTSGRLRQPVRVDPDLLTDTDGRGHWIADRKGNTALPVGLSLPSTPASPIPTDPQIASETPKIASAVGIRPVSESGTQPKLHVDALTKNTDTLHTLPPTAPVGGGVTAAEARDPHDAPSWQAGQILRLGGDTNIAPPPDKVFDWVKHPDQFGAELDNMRPAVHEGIKRMLAIREASNDLAARRAIPAQMMGDMMMWARLTSGATAAHHDSAFMRLVGSIYPHYFAKSMAGQFTPRDAEMWRHSISNLGLLQGSMGRNVTHNVNSIGKLLLDWGKPHPDGNGTYWDRMHQMINDPAISGAELRRRFHAEGFAGGGLGNKTFGLGALFLGKNNFVVDRIHATKLFPTAFERLRDRGYLREEASFGIAKRFDGIKGLAAYEGLEKAALPLAAQAHAKGILPRPDDLGGLHCLLWVKNGDQSTSHSALEGLNEVARSGMYGGMSTPTTMSRTPKQIIKEPTASEAVQRTIARDVTEGRLGRKDSGYTERQGYLDPKDIPHVGRQIDLPGNHDLWDGIDKYREEAMRRAMRKHGYGADFHTLDRSTHGPSVFLAPHKEGADGSLADLGATVAHHLGADEHYSYRRLHPDDENGVSGQAMRVEKLPTGTQMHAANAAIRAALPDAHIRAHVTPNHILHLHDYNGNDLDAGDARTVAAILAQHGIETTDHHKTKVEVARGKAAPLLKGRDRDNDDPTRRLRAAYAGYGYVDRQTSDRRVVSGMAGEPTRGGRATQGVFVRREA